MKKLKLLFILMVLFCIHFTTSQTVEIKGKVLNTSEVENIHVINKTSQIYTITNKLGEFKIKGKLNDTLILSSLKYKRYTTIFNEENISNRSVLILLQEQVNELDEVLVGKVLTGDLLLDVQNSDAKPGINFYDVGIPGYRGKRKTQSERRLHEAGEFKPIMLLGLLGGSLPLDPILNGITGRTKMLKKRVAIETKHELIMSIKARLSKYFFESNSLDENLKMDFFYFCSEDDNFLMRCKGKSDIEVLEFLKEKYLQYKSNIKTIKD